MYINTNISAPRLPSGNCQKTFFCRLPTSTLSSVDSWISQRQDRMRYGRVTATPKKFLMDKTGIFETYRMGWAENRRIRHMNERSINERGRCRRQCLHKPVPYPGTMKLPDTPQSRETTGHLTVIVNALPKELRWRGESVIRLTSRLTIPADFFHRTIFTELVSWNDEIVSWAAM